MPAPHVILASKTEQENQILIHKLEGLTKEFRNLHFFSAHHRGLPASLEDNPAVIVLNHQDWGTREYKDLMELRRIGYRGPILIVAKERSPEREAEFEATKNVVFIEKPFEAKDFEGIVRKMLNARSVAQRIHRRFNTDQSAEVESFGKNTSYLTRVTNLSVGGAYLEFVAATPVGEGELVRVKFDLDKLNKVYTMPARVVWAKNANRTVTTAAIGVEFIGPGDVKTGLMRES